MTEGRSRPRHVSETHWRSWVEARLVTLARVYFTWVFGWAILRACFGTRWWLLFLVSTFAEYLFLPLPLILAIALFTRRRETWVGFGAALALGVYLYGGLFLPSPAGGAGGATLTVMSYNMRGMSWGPQAVVAAIRTADADLVALQELNPSAAEAIGHELVGEYPYQVLDPQAGVTGMGAISRYPLRSTGETMAGEWIGTPQVLALDFDGKGVTVLHFHAFATNFAGQGLLSAPSTIEQTVRGREQQARAIVDFVAAHPGPLVALGDFNTADQSTAYGLVTDVLTDSWREAGWGFGHTFPGGTQPDGSRVTRAGVPLPMWLVRIDYVFHSEHWRAVSARIGPWDRISDHLPVVAELTWVQADIDSDARTDAADRRRSEAMSAASGEHSR
jgi:vancomycin resistance protein VanJ